MFLLKYLLIGAIAYFMYKRLSPSTDSEQQKTAPKKEKSDIQGGEYIDYEEIKEEK